MQLFLRHSCSLIARTSLIRLTTTSVCIRQATSWTSRPRPTLFDVTPKVCHPYIRLSRLDRPIGSWLLFWPGAWSIALAGSTLPNFALMGLFGLGAILMRGAGCTVNDIWDRELDRRV